MITHQGHISQVSANDYSLTQWVTPITSRASSDAKYKYLSRLLVNGSCFNLQPRNISFITPKHCKWHNTWHLTKNGFICQHCVDLFCEQRNNNTRLSDKIIIRWRQERLGGAAAIMKINAFREFYNGFLNCEPAAVHTSIIQLVFGKTPSNKLEQLKYFWVNPKSWSTWS